MNTPKFISMIAPPHDIDGHVIPHDHEEIDDNDFIIKGVTSHSIRSGRISKSLFKSSDRNPDHPYQGSSYDLEENNLRSYSDGKPFIGSIRVKVGSIREISPSREGGAVLVGWDPLPSNTLHAQAWNVSSFPISSPTDAVNFSPGQQKKICNSAQWRDQIDGIPINRYPIS